MAPLRILLLACRHQLIVRQYAPTASTELPGTVHVENVIRAGEAPKGAPLHAYVVLSLMTGIRTEDARALRWDHIVAWVDDAAEWRPVTEVGFDHERFAIYVWRSLRATGDTKPEKSRRTL